MNQVTEHDDVLAGMHPYRCSWTGFRYIYREGLGVIGFSGGAKGVFVYIGIKATHKCPKLATH